MLKLHQLTGIGLLATAVLTLTACSKQQNSESKPVSSPDSPDSYTPKIGLGVKTAARACFAIHNGDLTTGTAVTLVFPLAPVTIVQGTVSNVSKEPCPISQNVDTTVSNYSLDIKSPIPNLTPFIVVLGTPAVTVNANNVAQGDLNQNGQTQTFRACSADSGIHLTVWSGLLFKESCCGTACITNQAIRTSARLAPRPKFRLSKPTAALRRALRLDSKSAFTSAGLPYKMFQPS